MKNNLLSLFCNHKLTAFDYLALTGFAINMAVVSLIVTHWILG